ncbi:MAG: hypothetical protein AAGE80_05885 [Pseudomonadota bacterium]
MRAGLTALAFTTLFAGCGGGDIGEVPAPNNAAVERIAGGSISCQCDLRTRRECGSCFRAIDQDLQGRGLELGGYFALVGGACRPITEQKTRCEAAYESSRGFDILQRMDFLTRNGEAETLIGHSRVITD